MTTTEIHKRTSPFFFSVSHAHSHFSVSQISMTIGLNEESRRQMWCSFATKKTHSFPSLFRPSHTVPYVSFLLVPPFVFTT